MDFRAVIFVPALAGCVVVGFPLALYGAHAFLTIFQGTAAGAKQIEWPSDSIPEYFWKGFYLAWLIGLWLGPAFFVGRRLGSEADSAFLAYFLPMLVIWLMYPVSQMSSMSGPTIWLPLWPDVFLRLKQKPALTLSFYALSGLVLVAFGIAFHWTFGETPVIFLFFGAPLLVVAWLMYARLLGRVAFVLSFTKPWLEKKKVTSRKPVLTGRFGNDTEAPPQRDHEDRRRVQQPSTQEPLQSPDDEPVQGYDVKFQDDLPPAPPQEPEVRQTPPQVEVLPLTPEQQEFREREKRRRQHLSPSQRWDDEDDDKTPYIANAPEVAAEERAPKQLVEPKAFEMRLISREGRPKKPRRAWTAEVFLFLFEPATMGIALRLTFLCLIVGGFVKIAKSVNPAAGGEG